MLRLNECVESYKFGFLNFSTGEIEYMNNYKLTGKIISKDKITYSFKGPKRNTRRGYGSQLWFYKSIYNESELQLVDDLFNNLDEGNLEIIKGILHSKTKSDEN